MNSSHMAVELDVDQRKTRTRVARACDHCRRRKSKCDGLASCSACKCTGLSCSYSQVVKQARGVKYVAHLERTIEQLQNETMRFPAAQKSYGRRRNQRSKPPSPIDPSTPEERTSSTHDMPSLSHSNPSQTTSSTGRSAEPTTTNVEILAREPRAKLFGVDVLRQLCNFCYDLPRPGGPHRQNSTMKLVHALDNPLPLDDYPTRLTAIPPLPPNDAIFIWIELAFSEALHLWHFVDKGYLQGILHRIGQGEKDQDDLALLYAVIALGQRCEVDADGITERRMQGFSYFAAARDAVPLASCERSLPALQAVLCMALYLNAAPSVTKFHALVSSAASAALRMGLHEQVIGYAQEEQALRYRVWLTIQAMDVYASSALGLPANLMNTERNTENFESISSGADETTLAAAAHQQLTGVMHRCIDRIYRHRDVQAAATSVQPLVISTKSLRESTEELQTWAHNCAFIVQQLDALAPRVGNGSAAFLPRLAICTRTQLLLCYAYCNAQLLLYTPLVHHLVQPPTKRDSDAYLYGTNCMRAALAAVHIAVELQRRFQFNEVYIQTVDVLLNATLVLLMVQLGSSDSELLQDAVPAGRSARDVLLKLSLFSVKAAECWRALAPLYQTGKCPCVKEERSQVDSVLDNDVGCDSLKNSYSTDLVRLGGVGPFGVIDPAGFNNLGVDPMGINTVGVDPIQLWSNQVSVELDDDLRDS